LVKFVKILKEKVKECFENNFLEFLGKGDNTFIENLLDPYNNSHINDKNIITHLETLWFNSQEDDWLLKRQSDIEQVANRV